MKSLSQVRTELKFYKPLLRRLKQTHVHPAILKNPSFHAGFFHQQCILISIDNAQEVHLVSPQQFKTRFAQIFQPDQCQ